MKKAKSDLDFHLNKTWMTFRNQVFNHLTAENFHDMQTHVLEKWKFHHEFQMQDQILLSNSDEKSKIWFS